MTLVADLDRFTLNEVGFGDPVERLSFLAPSPTDLHVFPGDGLSLSVTDGNMDGFILALSGGVFISGCEPEDVRPFAGTIRMGNRDWHPRELTRERPFLEILGKPYWRDVDDQELLLFFECARGEMQVEVTLDDSVQVVLVTSAPLMADLEQREMYGVTKPWPPQPS